MAVIEPCAARSKGCTAGAASGTARKAWIGPPGPSTHRSCNPLLPGAGFSIEPGIYLPGEFGVRSEVNMVWAPAGPEVTPGAPQVDLITA